MKEILSLIFIIASLTSFAQKSPKVKLDWKISSEETITYLTIMQDIDTSSSEINLGNFLKTFSDSSSIALKESQDFLKKINKSFKNIDVLTSLTNKGEGIIEVLLKIRQKERTLETEKVKNNNKEAEALKMIQTMNEGIMLRGSVYKTGGIHSFWIKSTQKNLISLFFELPSKPVQIGDTWALEINFISNDQNFDCDSSFIANKVTLIDIKEVKGENIAVLRYEIEEFVGGVFYMPSFYNEPQKTMMKFSYQAIAEFSIDKGRWVSYDGIMTMKASGVMTANKKVKYSLIQE